MPGTTSVEVVLRRVSVEVLAGVEVTACVVDLRVELKLVPMVVVLEVVVAGAELASFVVLVELTVVVVANIVVVVVVMGGVVLLVAVVTIAVVVLDECTCLQIGVRSDRALPGSPEFQCKLCDRS
jgi:hypothetical protein